MNVFLQKNLGRFFFLIFVSWATLPLVNALEYQASVGTGITYNDNLPRNPNINRQDDTTYTAEFEAQAQHESERFDFNLNYLHEENHYDKNTFRDHPETDGSAYFAAHTPQRFATWFASHRIYEEVQNFRDQVDTPATRSTRNTYRTGPILNTSFRGSEIITLRGDYTVTDYEDSNDRDTKRFNGNLSWEHVLPQSRSITFAATASNTEPDGEVNSNTFRNEYSATFEGNISRGSYTAKIGYNTVDPDRPDLVPPPGATPAEIALIDQQNINRNKKRDGLSGEVSYLVDTPDHTFEFYVNQQLTDTGVDFDTHSRRNVNQDPNRPEELGRDRETTNFGEIEAVERTRAEIFFLDKDTIICRTCSLGGSIVYNKSDFDESLQNVDEERISYTLRLRMRLAPHTRLNVRMVYRDNFYEEGADPVQNPEREDDLYQIRAFVNHRFTQTLQARFELGANWRESRQELLEYEDYFARAFVRWTFL